MPTGNDIYKDENKKSYPPEVEARIYSDIEDMREYVKEGSTTDLCCGNCTVGLYLNADYYYDLYPAHYFVEPLDLEKGPFDKVKPAVNVFMFHALEHFDDTDTILTRIKNLMMYPGSRLFLAVPDADIDGNGYRPYDASIGHKMIFTKRTIAERMKNVGLKVLYNEQKYHAPNFYEILTVVER